MAKIIVDGKEIEVPDHYTLLQACEAAGAQIPRFCFHERLSVAGNCRMCLIEAKGGPPKPVASCAMGVMDMRPGPNGEPPEVMTNTPMVKKAREGVMEFLLINHPLDCPICDQGGECDLQDQAMAYGAGLSRYHEEKRSVENKNIGPLIKTIMTRCIHCTRCVRFTTEVAGISELGLTGRGENAEITSYLEQALTSELQGNVVDVCPVGALTSRPFAYTARPWELSKTDSIDVMDAVGSNIVINTRGSEVMRILPRLNEAVNEEWISDKTRYIWDGLKSQRLDVPYVRENGQLKPTSWSRALDMIAEKVTSVSGDKVGALAGDLCDVETMFAMKGLLHGLGSHLHECRQDNTRLHPDYGRASYLFNAGIEDIEEADAILIIGANPRHEAAILNTRIRKNWRQSGLPIFVLGQDVDLTYSYTHLGDDLSTLNDLPSEVMDALGKAERPLILIGQGALVRDDGASLLKKGAAIAKECGALTNDWNGFSLLHTAAARVGGLDLGFTLDEGEAPLSILDKTEVLFLLGADEVDASQSGAFKIYIGSHGDQGAQAADIILPAAAYPEKSALFVNTEGRVQMTNRASFPPGDAKEDWAIIRALSDVIGKTLPFDSLSQLRAKLFADYPFMAQIANKPDAGIQDLEQLADEGAKVEAGPPVTMVENFYFTNPIARSSQVMAECSAQLLDQSKQAAE